MTYEGLIYAVILTCGVLVLFDAKGLGARRGALGGGLLDMGYVGWFLSCVLLWIIAFPCYLITRPRLVRAHALATAAHGQSTNVPATPAPLAPLAPAYSREYAAAYGLPWTEPAPLNVPPPALSAPVQVPSSRGVRLAGVAAIVAVAALAVPASAQLERDRAAAGPTPAAAAHPATDLDATLSQVTLHAADFQAGYGVILAPGGDQVSGGATLHNCGHRFSTESARVARRQIEVTHHGRHTGVYNEVAAYGTDAQAAASLREWVDAADHCPHGLVPAAGDVLPTLTERVIRNTQHVSTLPNPANVVTVERIDRQDGSGNYLICVLQVRGRLLDYVFAKQEAVPNAADVRDLTHLAGLTGVRLATR